MERKNERFFRPSARAKIDYYWNGCLTLTSAIAIAFIRSGKILNDALSDELGGGGRKLLFTFETDVVRGNGTPFAFESYVAV